MSGAPAASEFDRVFRRHRRDTVLLHRPYPPHEGRRTNSRFGGLPGLPAHHDWPRASDGTPLHFLAQVDCADIAFPTPLPDRGVLFFFGRDEVGYAWDQDGPASDDCRVLYVLDAPAATPPREAPADLPRRAASRIWPTIHPTIRAEWPIHPMPIASWPDALPGQLDSRLLSLFGYARHLAPSARVWNEWRVRLNRLLGSDDDPRETSPQVEARERRYREQLNRLKADAFTEATGERSERKPNEITRDWKAGGAIFVHVEAGPQAYPQYWLTVHHCARTLLNRPSLGSDPELEAQFASEAEAWLRRASEAGLDAAVPEEARSAFRAWLRSMRPSGDESLSYGAAELVFVSTAATVQTWAGDPSRAARLPPEVYAALRYFFNGFTSSGVQFSQMLGHAPSSQKPLPPHDPTVCLLHLSGDCTFWITPRALARRDFSKVWRTIELY